jgi:hypothetical protein
LVRGDSGGWKPPQHPQSLPTQAEYQSATADFASVAATYSRRETGLKLPRGETYG